MIMLGIEQEQADSKIYSLFEGSFGGYDPCGLLGLLIFHQSQCVREDSAVWMVCSALNNNRVIPNLTYF